MLDLHCLCFRYDQKYNSESDAIAASNLYPINKGGTLVDVDPLTGKCNYQWEDTAIIGDPDYVKDVIITNQSCLY